MSDETAAAAAAAAAPDDPPTPDGTELMRDIESYDEATLDRVLRKLADKAETEATVGAATPPDVQIPSPQPPPPPPPSPPPPLPSLTERLLAVFPDACPDWVRQEAVADADLESLVSQWLAHGYRKRVKKWRQQLQQEQQPQHSSEQRSPPPPVEADPDEGTLFDWRRQRRGDFQLRQPVFDALAREFPLVALRSVSQVVKAFKYCLPAAYRFLYKMLAFTGRLGGGGGGGGGGGSANVATAALAAAAAGDATFARLPFDCPQLLDFRPQEPAQTPGDISAASAASAATAAHHCSLLRRRTSELERHNPEVLAELRFVRSLLADEAAAEAEAAADAAEAVAALEGGNSMSSNDPGATTSAAADAADAAAASASAQQQPNYECECCFGDCTFDALCQCPEGHLFCRPCLAAYVREKVFGSGRLSLACLAPACDRQFLRSQLCLAVDAATLARLDERAAEDSVRGLESLFRCPACGWGAEIEEPLADAPDAPGPSGGGSSSSSKVFSCQNCEKEVCRLCGVDWEEHFGRRCAEIERDSETRLRREFEERMTQARVRTCYQCKASVMKSTGCNHMTCRCGAHFCYICRGALPSTDPYSHFCNHGNPAQCNCGRCPVQSSTEQDEKRAIDEIRAQGTKRQREEGFQERPIGAPDPPKRARRE